MGNNWMRPYKGKDGYQMAAAMGVKYTPTVATFKYVYYSDNAICTYYK